MSNHLLIYGYGREGQSTEDFLYRHHYPEVIDIYDQKTHPIRIDWHHYDQIWLSPGVDPKQIPQDHQQKVTTQADYFFMNLSEEQRRKVIAITGSKGKTSTTQAVAHFLEKLGYTVGIAGNIGTPLLDQLDVIDQLDYLVTEISSFQAESIRRSPHTVIFLNLFGDHLDRHGNMEGYLKAKAQLWSHQREGDHLIVAKGALDKVDNPNAIIAKPLTKKDYPLSSVLNADHFRQNLGVLPVLTDVLDLPWTPEQLQAALETTPLPSHRLEHIGDWQGLAFYDDAIATNPTATTAAVTHFGKDLGFLILGGKSSEDDPTSLLEAIKKRAPNAQVIITDSPFLKEIKGLKTNLKYTVVKNLEAAFKIINHSPAALDQPKIVLLSPAAKSFDQYPNYEAKGDHFEQLFRNLESKKQEVKKERK